MHEYAIFGHDRASIGRWLGIISLALAGGFTQLISWGYEQTGFEVFTKATITTGAIYYALHMLVNKIIWRRYFSEVPNLNGEWRVIGATLDEEGNTKYNWEASIGIEQTWEKICIHLRTSESQSQSYTANLLKKHGPTGGWLLSYSYKNEPEIEQSHQLNSHKGYCEIDFNNLLTTGKANYFNSGGRRTFGIMTLEKVND